MTLELWCLVFMGFFVMVLGYVTAIAKIKSFSIIQERNFNRDNLPPLTGVGARAERAQANLYENLPAFAIVVIIAHLTQTHNDWTVLGAELFVLARILHPVFYLLGIHYLRSLSYMVGLVGTIMIALQLG